MYIAINNKVILKKKKKRFLLYGEKKVDFIDNLKIKAEHIIVHTFYLETNKLS